MLCILGIAMLVMFFGGFFCLIGLTDSWKTVCMAYGVMAGMVIAIAWVFLAIYLITTYCFCG